MDHVLTPDKHYQSLPNLLVIDNLLYTHRVFYLMCQRVATVASINEIVNEINGNSFRLRKSLFNIDNHWPDRFFSKQYGDPCSLSFTVNISFPSFCSDSRSRSLWSNCVFNLKNLYFNNVLKTQSHYIILNSDKCLSIVDESIIIFKPVTTSRRDGTYFNNKRFLFVKLI